MTRLRDMNYRRIVLVQGRLTRSGRPAFRMHCLARAGEGSSSFGDEIEVLRRQGAVDERLLSVSGLLQHVLAHQAQRAVDFDARLDDPRRKGQREGAVVAVAVVGT